MDCCSGNEEQTASTFSLIFNKIQVWIFSVLNGDFLNHNQKESDKDADSEDTQNIVVSVLFLIHVTVVFFFLAHHCTPRGVAQGRTNYY